VEHEELGGRPGRGSRSVPHPISLRRTSGRGSSALLVAGRSGAPEPPGGRRSRVCPSEVVSTSIGVPYRREKRVAADDLLRRAGRPARPPARYTTRSREDRMGLTSWATRMTGDFPVPADARDQGRHRRLVRKVEAVERTRRSSMRAGLRTSAWAMRSRCCSPPYTWPTGALGIAGCPDEAEPPRRPGGHSSRRRRPIRPSPGRGTPHPVAVETEADDVDATHPKPRLEAAALGQVHRCGHSPRPGAFRGSGLRRRARGSRPSSTLMSVDLAGAIGPDDGHETHPARPSG